MIWAAPLIGLVAAACSRQSQCWIDEGYGQGGAGPLPPGQGGQGAFGDNAGGGEADALGGCDDGTSCQCYGYIVCRWVIAPDPNDGPGENAGVPWHPCGAPDEEFPNVTCAKLVSILRETCLEDAIAEEHERGRTYYQNPAGYECKGIPLPDKLYFHCTQRTSETKPWR